ncbi:MAG TPA: QueT transporter family protein, partial [Candidatus Atribacteria bacterium]|nr:QueT transporter family protein [Candidatus Atribacteria bacterium]
MKNRDIAWISMISALYVIITLIFAYISYGPIQVRISEALTLLPFFDKRAIFA